jgi:hypothetical protein
VAELVSRPGAVGRASPIARTVSRYVGTQGGGDGSDGFISNLGHARGGAGDNFSAAAAVALGATAGAAAAEAVEESVVAAAEAPAHLVGRAVKGRPSNGNSSGDPDQPAAGRRENINHR